MPIHELFVKNRVNIVFHGHDHLFVKEELDGIIYQEVPQPGHPTGGTRSAEEYGYGGVILGSAGHIRVTVSENEAKLDYLRSIVPGVRYNAISPPLFTYPRLTPGPTMPANTASATAPATAAIGVINAG